MRFRVAAGLVFALLMFLIPLLALVGNVDMVQYSPREDASLPQASAPAGTGQAAPEKDPSAPAASSGTTPAVTVADDGFRILDDRTGKVFEVSARDYVRGALAAEMPPTFHPEALKAQAVAAHTYALRLREQNRAAPDESLKGADFSADPQGLEELYDRKALPRAVRRSGGRLLEGDLRRGGRGVPLPAHLGGGADRGGLPLDEQRHHRGRLQRMDGQRALPRAGRELWGHPRARL